MSTRPDTPFSITCTVYWEDTDAGGVVYHARYVALLERARSEWVRELGYGQQALMDQLGLVFAVRAMRMNFRKPARLDDVLRISAELTHIGHASLTFTQRILRGDELLLDAEVKLAALDAASFRPRGIGSPLLEQCQAYLRG